MKTITVGALALCAALLSKQGLPAEVAAPSTAPSTEAPVPPAAMSEKDPQVAAVAVTQALRGSRDLDSKEISVTTHGAAVILGGTVATEAEASRALALAEKAADGVRVSSSIKVEPPAGGTVIPASLQLVRDVEAALRRDPRTANLGITVSIDEQQVIGLHGLVPSPADRTAAQSVAQQVKGVNRLQNRLVTPGDK